MTPPRILYCAEILWPSIGGIETYTQALLPRLKQRGYEIHTLSGDGGIGLPDTETVDGVVMHRLPLRLDMESGDPGRLLEGIRKVRALKQQVAPDIVHINFSGPIAFYHLRTKGVAPCPMLTTIHGPVTGLRGGAGTLLAEMFASSDWVIANSRSVLEDVHAAAPGVTGRSSVIYYGVDAPDVESAAPSLSPPRLLCIGRLVTEKGVDVAIEAFAEVRRRFPDATLVVAGDGVERPALEHRARELGLGDAVHFTGWVPPADVPRLMAEASLVLVPSRWQEPFGLVAVEASLQGRPVLACSVGGLREAVEDGVSGRHVPPDDTAAFAAAAIGMLSDPEGLAAMGDRGRERARRLFGMDANVDALDQLYRRLTA